MRKFLLVDDSATIRLGLAKAIRAARGASVEVHEADQEADALKLFRDIEPDVVFLDMVFPDEDRRTNPDKDEEERGLGILRAMLRERPGARVVLITGLPSNHPDVVDAINLGAAGWVRKPVRAEDVRAVLDSMEEDDGQIDYIM